MPALLMFQLQPVWTRLLPIQGVNAAKVIIMGTAIVQIMLWLLEKVHWISGVTAERTGVPGEATICTYRAEYVVLTPAS